MKTFITHSILSLLLVASPSITNGESFDADSYKPEQLPAKIFEYVTASLGLSSSGNGSADQKAEVDRFFNYELSEQELALRTRYWVGSEIEAVTDLTTDIIWEGSPKGDGAADTTTVFVEFLKDAVLVKLQHPFSKTFLGGFRVSYPAQSRSVLFLEGSKGRSFIVLVPPKGYAALSAVALCPRHFEEGGNEYEVRKITHNGYLPVEAGFKGIGKAKGRFSTVGFSAYARAAILVGPGLEIPRPFEDVARTSDPAVFISYKADSAGTVKVDLARSTVSGVKGEVKLANPAGYSRSLSKETRIQINPVMVEDDLSVLIGGILHPVSRGPCAIVSRYDEKLEDFGGK